VQVAEALDYAHRQGVLHRDIKPSNLLLDTQGTVWVTDFGLAKAVGSDELTQPGDVVGTLRYMAPERFRGESEPRSDEYSLGITLYEMLTLRPAFEDANRARLIHRIAHEEPPRPRQVDRRIPLDLETIVLKAMDKESGRRYATVGEVAEDLRRFLADRPVQARRTSLSERAWRWCRRNPARATAASLAVVAMLAVVALAIGSVFVMRLRQEQAKTEKYRHEAEQLSASLALERGLTLAEQGEVAQGMLWMIRGLKIAPEDDAELQRDLRTSLAVWHRQLHPLRAVFQHSDWVECVFLSPDGKRLATGCMDGNARLWDVATGLQIGPNLEHQKGRGVVYVDFTRDSQVLVTWNQDGVVRFWEAASGKRLPYELKDKEPIGGLMFSPDGKSVLTVSNKSAQMWELSTGKRSGPSMQLPGEVAFMVFSPDSRTFLMADQEGAVHLLDVAAGKRLKELFKLPRGESILYLRDLGEVILTEGAQGLRQWDAVTGKQRGVTLPANFVKGAAATFDGGTIYRLTGDPSSARLWDADTGEPLGSTLRHRDGIRDFAFSADGKVFATGSFDHTARVWERGAGKSIAHVFHLGAPCDRVAFSPDGRTIATATENGAFQLWDAVSKKAIGSPVQHQNRVTCVKYSPDSRIVVTSDAAGAAHVLETATGNHVGQALQHKEEISDDTDVAISRDSRIIVTGSYDGTVRLWEAATARPIGPPLEHKSKVWSVDISPDGKMVVTGSEDGSILFWSVATARQVGPALKCDGWVVVTFSPDGRTILAGSQDGMARVWDVSTGKLLFPPLKHQNWLNLARFSPDGRSILTGDSNGATQVWDAATGERLGKPFPAAQCLASAAWSPDSKNVVTGTNEGIVRLWDATSGKPAGPRFMRHQGVVRIVAFSPDGKYILSGGADKTARLWELPTPVHGDVDLITLWVQVLTGMELDENDVFHVLDAAEWQERRQHLEELGGAPIR
jgi:WD40 repeat protein